MNRDDLARRRDTASTAAQAVAVQAFGVPWRIWRRGLSVALVAVPLALAILASIVGADTLARWSLLGACPGIIWHLAHYLRRRQRVRLALEEQGLRSTGDVGDQAALDRRAAAMVSWARARNLPYRPTAPPEPWSTGENRNEVIGTVDGLPFRCYDRIAFATSGTRDGPTRVHVDGADTTVALPFPTAVGLAVTPDGADSTLRWSHLGAQIDLESGDFNDRFNVYCDDPVRARLVLNPAVMAALLDWPDPLRMVLTKGELRLTALTTLLDPERLDGFIALAVRVSRSARAAIVA